MARDRELVERCQLGDMAAFDALYRRYRRRLLRFCQQRLREPHEAEDVVQETFARAWRTLPRFGGERRFYPWLTVIASHLCTDTLRRRARCTPVEGLRLSFADTGHYDVEDAVLRQIDSALFTAAFSSLSDRHQRVLQLREGSEWSYQRIADHEGVPIGTIETLLWRARQALKREFTVLCGPEGRMGALVGSAILSFRRVFFRHVFHHLAPGPIRHPWSSTQGLLAEIGPFGSLAAPFVAATGAVAISVGTMIMVPLGWHARPETVSRAVYSQTRPETSASALQSLVPGAPGIPSRIWNSAAGGTARPAQQVSRTGRIPTLSYVVVPPGASAPATTGPARAVSGSAARAADGSASSALDRMGTALPSAPRRRRAPWVRRRACSITVCQPPPRLHRTVPGRHSRR